ncbi:hypothetical protein DVH24_016642 [Malus domestica]|uniref:Uncharacterized protein n=1 Tax=Malus domestica TaxID=3750 RepID=A0A498HSV0_MALDO|nr:hypothetical protein DVH24_016642 [Malus domestica]
MPLLLNFEVLVFGNDVILSLNFGLPLTIIYQIGGNSFMANSDLPIDEEYVDFLFVNFEDSLD